jgi:excisionase family DNA binding protein
VEADLTDAQVAELLGKHKRTIQRWCAADKLPGSYRAGRSWRIPRSALRDMKLSNALIHDDGQRELRAAVIVCEELRWELDSLRRRGPLPPQPASKRNWPVLAREAEQLQRSLDGLPELASRVPMLDSSGNRIR